VKTQNENVAAWFKTAKKQKSKGVVDMCDTWDYTHYAVFFGGPDDQYKTAEEILAAKNGKNMQSSFGVFQVE
jgi:hypothetical protein